jgi:hypothetical protein
MRKPQWYLSRAPVNTRFWERVGTGIKNDGKKIPETWDRDGIMWKKKHESGWVYRPSFLIVGHSAWVEGNIQPFLIRYHRGCRERRIAVVAETQN